jgi:hypothetical protein
MHPLVLDMEPTYGDFEFANVEAIDALRDELKRINESKHPSKVLADLFMNGHEGSSGYLSFGNTKISKSVAIFNMNSATDCPNAKTKENGESETGLCQVPWDDCYAHKAENGLSPDALDKRRRQQYLWETIDAVTFAKALKRTFDRKRRDITAVRFSESGDFRHRGDIIKVDRIARMIDTDVYTYSASHKLDWSEAKHFTVNQSNNLADYGARLFSAVLEPDDVPENGVLCPFELARHKGVDTDERPKCGDCRLCIDEDGPDVYVLLH